MRSVVASVCVVAASTFSLLLAGPALADERLTPNHLWEGEFGDEKLKQEAPEGGVIVDAKVFAKLWRAWHKNDAVPEVDFKKELAFVAICSTKGERPVPVATLQGGDLSVSWDAARRGRGGWGYAILTYDRKQVKRVNGVEFESADREPKGPRK
jgi:hypothetical protein